MNKKIKYIIISLIAILIITIAIIIVIKYNESKETVTPIEEPENTSEENVMVIGINTENTTSQEEQKQPENNNKPEEPTKEPNQEPEQTRDASALTQEIYNMNTTIGTLYIPKTKLNTKVYCNPDPKKMEKMPAFLYTSGGLNQVGITLFVGHNRRNGKILAALMNTSSKKLITIAQGPKDRRYSAKALTLPLIASLRVLSKKS